MTSTPRSPCTMISSGAFIDDGWVSRARRHPSNDVRCAEGKRVGGAAGHGSATPAKTACDVLTPEDVNVNTVNVHNAVERSPQAPPRSRNIKHTNGTGPRHR